MTRDDKVSVVDRSLCGAWSIRPENEILVTDSWAQLTTPGVPVASMNGVFRSVLQESEVDAKIEEVRERYVSLGLPFWWLVTPGTRPLDMGSRLVAKGFQRSNTAIAMVADPAQIHLPRAEGTSVEPVVEANLEDWLAVQAAGWSLPPAASDLARRHARRRHAAGDQSRIDLLVRFDGVPCATGTIRFCDGFALLVGGVVLPPFQTRGAFRSGVSVCLEIIASRGVPLVVSHCILETSAPIFRHFGFEDIYEIAYYRFG